jgi:hypothetical protein
MDIIGTVLECMEKAIKRFELMGYQVKDIKGTEKSRWSPPHRGN